MRYKNVGEVCTYSQECQSGSFCSDNGPNTKICLCKTGFAFSERSKQCVKGLKGSLCRNNSDCVGHNVFCSIQLCECKYGYEWYAPEESCYRKAKFGENCETSINCKVHDEFSECDAYSKQCTCGQFLSRKYALDEVTRKCVSCPRKRYRNSTNSCVAEKTTVEYSLLDQSAYERNSHQYIYIALSMTPFIVFALIGFIYRYVNPNASFPDNMSDGGLEAAQMLSLSLLHNPNHDYCLHLDVNPNNNNNQTTNEDAEGNRLCLLTSPVIHDPPPTYDIASKDLPPSYDEVVVFDQRAHNN